MEVPYEEIENNEEKKKTVSLWQQVLMSLWVVFIIWTVVLLVRYYWSLYDVEAKDSLPSLSGQNIVNIDTLLITGIDTKEIKLQQLFEEIDLEIETADRLKKAISKKYNEVDDRLVWRMPEWYEEVLNICNWK